MAKDTFGEYLRKGHEQALKLVANWFSKTRMEMVKNGEYKMLFEEDKDRLLDQKLDEMYLSVYVTKSLRKKEIITLRDLVKYGKNDLLKMGFGKKSISELANLLALLDLSFEMKLN